MTVSARHENSNARIKVLLRQLGHEIWENSDERGRGGWQLPMVICDDNKPRGFIVDCMCRLKSGAMLAFEVDLNHETTERKIRMLAKFGIVTVPVNPKDVDNWVKDPALLEREIIFRLK